MIRNKLEVRNYLNSVVGTTVPDQSNHDLDGQCVALIKGLMAYLRVPDPYKARGNARDAGDAYLKEGIADPGRGWLTIVVNRDMGRIGNNTYGHIWVDLQDEANYEQNGAIALRVTKNTRPFNQGQQYINLDKWVKDEAMEKMSRHELEQAFWSVAGYAPSKKELDGWYQGVERGDSYKTTMKKLIDWFGNDPRSYNYYKRQAGEKIKELEARIKELETTEFIKVSDLYIRREK